MEYFCKACLQHKEHTRFTKWIREGKVKATRCDSCHDTELLRERQEAEAAAKAKYIADHQPLPLSVRHQSNTDDDAKIREVKRRIEDIKQAQLDRELFDL